MNQWKYKHLIKKGLRHESSGAACQDYICTAEDDNCIVIALCDGIGSLPASGLAAQYTAEAACRMMQNCAAGDFRPHVLEQDELLKAILLNINALLEKKLSAQGIDRHQSDSTLAFVCVSKLYNFCYAVCLGDSAVCLMKRSGCHCLTESNSCSESTATVDMKEPWSFAKQTIVELDSDDFWGAILTSDGLDGEIYAKDSTIVYKASELYFNAMLAESFDDAVNERLDVLCKDYGDYFDDDISVAVISRVEQRVLLREDPTWLCRCGERNALAETYCHLCRSDFIDVYRRVTVEQCGGQTRFFRYANGHPDFEKKAIGMEPQ